jgi:hypothetical protein
MLHSSSGWDVLLMCWKRRGVWNDEQMPTIILAYASQRNATRHTDAGGRTIVRPYAAHATTISALTQPLTQPLVQRRILSA